jgi:hypothetical protein
MVTSPYTFTVHDGVGQDDVGQRSKEIRAKHSVGKNKVVIIPNNWGRVISKTFFVIENCETLVRFIECIKFDEIIHRDSQKEIMKAFTRFILERYPLVTFTINNNQFCYQKFLLCMMKTDEFSQQFDNRVCCGGYKVVAQTC